MRIIVGIIKVIKRVLFDLIATSEKEHPYTYETWTNVESEADHISCELSIEVNGVPRSDAVKSGPKREKGCVKHEIQVSLKDFTKYSICVKEEKVYNIHSDFLIGFRPKHLTNNLRTQLLHPENNKVLFSSPGTQLPFQEVINSKTP